MLYKWLNGFFMYQLEPAFFYTRKDLITWMLMQTGMHGWLLQNHEGWILLDVLFYSMPLLYLLVFIKVKKWAPIIALLMLLVNWCYVQCYTLYPSNSIEGHFAWLLYPLVFLASGEKTFSFLYDGLRYFFLYFFVSAGVWKLAQGGAFNPSQMSGILLYQHNQLLTNSPGYWQSDLIYYLLQHNWLSFLLYWPAIVLELFFVTGFFTKNYDRLLFYLFILFLVLDYLIMRIPYFEIAALALPLVIKNKSHILQTHS